MEVLLSITVGVFGVGLIMLSMFYTNLKSRYKILQGGYDDAISNKNYWTRRCLSLEENVERDKERFVTQFQNNIKIGDTFYVPDSNVWKEGFKGTHQKIISINFGEGKFNSVSAITDMGPRGFESWSNNFGQIKEFTWANKQSRLKHKFI